MIKHIVLFKLTDYKNEEDKQKKMIQMQQTFGGLKEKINVISKYEVGLNFNTTNAAYDVIINSEFDTIEDLNAYVRHEEHQKAIQQNSSIAKTKAVVDYEI